MKTDIESNYIVSVSISQWSLVIFFCNRKLATSRLCNTYSTNKAACYIELNHESFTEYFAVKTRISILNNTSSTLVSGLLLLVTSLGCFRYLEVQL